MNDVPAIETIGLTKKFGSFTAISDISIRVNKGEYMGLLGPNGAGKSTTLKVVSGLIFPTSGSVRIEGIDIKDHRRAMSHVGCVIETPEPYPTWTPAEILEYVGRIYGLDSREIAIRSRDVLEIMKMWDWRDKTIGGFSKGMRQRVVLAQALLPNPSIIILDEPTSGLDPRGMIEVRRALAALKAKDRTLLISTHMLKEVSELCGSVAMIRDGRVVTSGKVDELIHGKEGSRKTTLDIRSRRPFTPEILTDLRGMAGVGSVTRTGDCSVSIEFTGTTEQQEHVVDMVYGSGLGIVAVNEKGADLESLYMDMTRGEDVR